MKRGQAEIIGLMLIVILIAIGFLLYVRFSLKADSGPSFKESFEESQLGQTFVNSLAKTEFDCNGQFYTIEEVIEDVAKGTPRCAGGGVTTEERLDDFFSQVLLDTHYLWGRNYKLSVVRRTEPVETFGISNQTNPDIDVDDQCMVTRRMQRTRDYYPLPAYDLAIPVEIRLELCS